MMVCICIGSSGSQHHHQQQHHHHRGGGKATTLGKNCLELKRQSLRHFTLTQLIVKQFFLAFYLYAFQGYTYMRKGMHVCVGVY